MYVQVCISMVIKMSMYVAKLYKIIISALNN